MSTSGLDSRVAGVLSRAKALPDDVAGLLAEVERALADTERELAQATAQALDPTSTSAVIASARGVTFDAQFRLQRLVAARDRLVEKHAAAVERVEAERRAAAHAGLVAERDRVSEKLEETYARAAGEIANVLDEAVQVNRDIAAWNTQAAGSRIDELPPLHKGVRLPALRSGEAAFWPPVERLDTAAMVPEQLRLLAEARAKAAKESAEVRALWDRAARLNPQRRRVPV
jgi:hypothetical protein